MKLLFINLFWGFFSASAAGSMNPVTTASVTSRGGYSSVKSRQPQMQSQQMTDHHHNQRQMLPDQQHIQGYPSQQQQHLSNNSGQ